MALSFDAGGAQRQRDFWVQDLTEQEATELLRKHGHGDKAKDFLDACALAQPWRCLSLSLCQRGGYRALDLVDACERYVNQASLQEKKAQMEETAGDEVRLLSEFKIQTTDGIVPVGQNILTALKQNLLQGDGQGVVSRVAGPTVVPRDVAEWMRERDRHPVIWHMVNKKFRFASKFHADAAFQ